MLITFKSKSAAEVMMYADHAKRILDLFGKDVKRGVITADEASGALAKLEAEIASNKAHSPTTEMQRDIDVHHGVDGDDNEHEPSQQVSFSTRAYPLLEMLRAAEKTHNDILWGV